MKKLHYILISCSMFLLGFVLYLVHSYTIFLKPFATETIEPSTTIVSKKKVTLFFWEQDVWKHETVEIIWPDNIVQTLEYLIVAWLTFLDEEKNNNKKVSLQSVALSPSKREAFVSFDRNPFEKKNTTYEKWLWVESLFKTLRENGNVIQSIQLLIHHQPIIDYHIDFSKPWPITGFLQGKG